MTLPSIGEMILLLLSAIVCWIVTKIVNIEPTCHCDDSDQGRNCKGCTPPHIPRREP